MSDNKQKIPGLARRTDGFNRHVTYSTSIYLFSAIVFGVVWYALMSMIPDLSANDPNVQIRLLVGKTTVVIVGMALVNGLLQVIEAQTNGNLIGRILQSPVSAAIYTSVQLLCATIMWIYS